MSDESGRASIHNASLVISGDAITIDGALATGTIRSLILSISITELTITITGMTGITRPVGEEVSK